MSLWRYVKCKYLCIINSATPSPPWQRVTSASSYQQSRVRKWGVLSGAQFWGQTQKFKWSTSARVCALSTTRAGQDAAAEADHNYGELVSPSLARLLPRDTWRVTRVTLWLSRGVTRTQIDDLGPGPHNRAMVTEMWTWHQEESETFSGKLGSNASWCPPLGAKVIHLSRVWCTSSPVLTWHTWLGSVGTLRFFHFPWFLPWLVCI